MTDISDEEIEYLVQYHNEHEEKHYFSTPIYIGTEIIQTPQPQTALSNPIISDLNVNEESFTDITNAKRFVNKYGSVARYVPVWDSWVIWNGRYWERDRSLQILRLAKQTILPLYSQLSTIEDSDKRKSIFRGINSCESVARLKAMVELAKIDSVTKDNEFDTNLMLFNCHNGTLDLRTGELKPFNPNDKMTKISEVIFDKDAKCPKWLDTVSKAFHNSPELIKYYQKICGYTMTGNTKEQCFFIFWGSGKNLKSTILNVQEEVLGEYSILSDTSTFMKKDTRGTSGDLVRLRSARFVKAIESDMGQKLAESIIKTVCSDDGIVCRNLFESEQEYNVEFKLILATNNKPEIHGTDLGTWRRIKLVPFTYTAGLDGSAVIQDYHKIIIGEELSGVLNWMLEGCLLWQKEGLVDCKEVSDATNEYMNENNSIGEFIQTEITRKANNDISNQDLYNNYCNYCDDNGIERRTIKEFKKELEKKGFVSERKKFGMIWKNVILTVNLPNIPEQKKIM